MGDELGNIRTSGEGRLGCDEWEIRIDGRLTSWLALPWKGIERGGNELLRWANGMYSAAAMDKDNDDNNDELE